MSDTTNDAPLDPDFSSAPTDSNPIDSDPNQVDDPNAGAQTDSNSGTPEDAPGQDGSDADGSENNSTGTVADTLVPTGPTPTATASSLSTTVPDHAGDESRHHFNPNHNDGSGHGLGSNAPASLSDRNDTKTTAIIIASSLSGAIALILALVVVILVYRRRNTKRKTTAAVDTTPSEGHRRQDSDATWVDGTSFEDAKLEAGNRKSEAAILSQAATLSDFAAARAKSGAFSTPSHTPRPSLDKVKTQVEPMVPVDPFEKPRLSIGDKTDRRSLDQATTQPLASNLKGRRKSSTPSMQIDSGSSFSTTVEIEQGYVEGPMSPGSPMLPLVTPLGPPPGWRTSRMEFLPAPTRRGSMVSLSRQSSRASSRNSQILEPGEPNQEARNTTRANPVAILAKKRRSRADSIDPFRKSAGPMSALRKSRAESIASARDTYGAPGSRRKSRGESVSRPTSPGPRRKSRAGSMTPSLASRRRSQASSIASPTRSAIFTAPVEFMPPVMGLPSTPRTPTAARRSRGAEPRTPGTPASREPYPARPREPRTPATAMDMRTPRTPASARALPTPRTPGGHPRMPSASVPRTPTSVDDAVPDSAVSIAPIPASEPRPLPPVPTSGRAELRLSQLSRALSEVSSKHAAV